MMSEETKLNRPEMAKKPKTAETAAAPDGATTGTGVEKEKDKVPDEKHNNDVPTATAAPAEQLVINVPVHCDGCARKLRRSLLRTDGIGEVEVDRRSNTVVIRGRKVTESATEMVKIVERKTGEKAVLMSPSPEKLSVVKWGKIEEGAVDEEVTNKEDMAEEELMEMVVVLRMNLHCDACCEEIKRRILKIKGVEDAVPQLKSSQVLVKGVVEPATLVGFIHKCTGKKAVITRAEPLHLLPSSNSPAPQPTTPAMDVPPVTESDPKQQDPSDNLEAEPNGEKQEKNGGVQEENTGGEGEDADANEKGPTERPNDGHGAEEHGTNNEVPNNASHVVVEKNHKNDNLLSVALPAGVVTVAPEMALDTLNPYYYSYIAYPTHPYHYQYPQPYPYAACNPATYGYEYGCPHYSPAFSEENPNACSTM